MTKIITTVVFCIILAISLINPVFPHEQFLQHTATLAALGIMIYLIRSRWISNLSFILFASFMLLHIIGARWIYTYVPYDQWSKAVFNLGLNEMMDWKRNNYDRLVHFLYGLLLYIPVREILITKLRFSPMQGIYVTFEFILASSMVYELFEWSLTLFMSPYDADNYNGQQGDLWDSQKDMALAALGGLIMASRAVLLFRIRKVNHR